MWFMAHTGCRLNEAVSASWSQFDLEKKTWTIPGRTRKNTTGIKQYPDLIITLPPQVINLLRELEASKKGAYVFSLTEAKLGNWDRNAKPLQEITTVIDWHRHDIRHYFKTTLTALGVTEEVAEEALGHVKKGVGGVYNHYRYPNERAAALIKLANHLEKLTEKQLDLEKVAD